LWVIDNAHKGGVRDIILSNNLKFLATGGEEVFSLFREKFVFGIWNQEKWYAI